MSPSTTATDETSFRRMKAHPRLLATEFDSLRRTVRETDFGARLYAKVKADADATLSREESVYALYGDLHILYTSRQVLARTYNLALAFLVERDRRYLDRLWRELAAAAAFPDWNSDRHFLDTAEMTHAFAISYDWLHDEWSPEQRSALREAIIEKGLVPGLAVYASGSSGATLSQYWNVMSHNWNIVCNAGLALGALAVYEDDRETSRRVLAEVAKSIPLGVAEFAPEGAYPEGAVYWAYAMKYLVVYLAALDSATGADGGLADSPGLAETGFFPMYLTGPTDQVFNYYDARPESVQPAEMFWLARRYHHPVLSWWGMQGADAKELSWEQIPVSLLWYDPHLIAHPSTATLPLDHHYAQGCEIVSMRSRWDDPNALFLAFKGGDNSTNHGDLDLGTFVLDALGFRWAEDLGPDDYHLPGYWDKQPGGQRWNYYRKRAEGHNTVVINPGLDADQSETARGTITTTSFGVHSAHAIAELTEARRELDVWRRGIRLFDDRRQVLVQDEISCSVESEIWWFMHTSAEVSIDPDGRSAVLSLSEARLLIRIVSPVAAAFQVDPAAPLPSSPNPVAQQPIQGLQRLAIRLAGVTDCTIMVQFSPLQPGSSGPPIARCVPLDSWTATR